jgi:DNA polymerase III alpha subunit (gram-positive type)
MIVCIFDTETTGLIDNHSRKLDQLPEVIEFAAVWAEWDNIDEIVANYECLIKPQHGPLSDKVKQVTHLTDEHLAYQPTFDQVSDKIQAMLTATPIICGHNLSYDMEMIDIEYERLKRRIRWPATKICTVEQTIHVTGNRINLGDLHLRLTGQPHVNAHRAMEDVMATHRCLREIRAQGWL